MTRTGRCSISTRATGEDAPVEAMVAGVTVIASETGSGHHSEVCLFTMYVTIWSTHVTQLFISQGDKPSNNSKRAEYDAYENGRGRTCSVIKWSRCCTLSGK